MNMAYNGFVRKMIMELNEKDSYAAYYFVVVYNNTYSVDQGQFKRRNCTISSASCKEV